MHIYLNDKEIDIAPGTTLEALLNSQNLGMPGVAVAVDGKVVRRDERASKVLTEGAKVLAFKAVCGG